MGRKGPGALHSCFQRIRILSEGTCPEALARMGWEKGDPRTAPAPQETRARRHMLSSSSILVRPSQMRRRCER